MTKKGQFLSVPLEKEEQQALIKWAKLKRLPLIHIPNESRREAYYGAFLVRMGLSKGFPDLFLPLAHGGFFGMFIEMKRNKAYRPSEKTALWVTQEEWLKQLTESGYYAKFAYGWKSAVEMIESYLTQKSTKELYGQKFTV